nr:immunoglobulin heavy chain junction region [Mus musculus]MBK4187250.1 immunoglobulin heavy chain junction region [Mus musculus]
CTTWGTTVGGAYW